jgi:arylsulfatase A-like enzyme
MRDCLLKVPLIVKASGLPKDHKVDSLTSHVDFPGTILSLLENESVSVPWPSHGGNLMPEMFDGASRTAIFAEGGHEKAMRDSFNSSLYKTSGGVKRKAVDGKHHVYHHNPDTMAKAKMVRTDEWKLVVRETGQDELFSILEDPYEQNNLHSAPGTDKVVSKMQRLLLDWCLKTDPDTPVHSKVGA